MTVQAGIEVDVDLAVMVGELEEQACESGTHKQRHVDGPATHYAKVSCYFCGVNVVKAYCEWMVARIRDNARFFCFNCHVLQEAQDHITILTRIRP